MTAPCFVFSSAARNLVGLERLATLVELDQTRVTALDHLAGLRKLVKIDVATARRRSRGSSTGI
jgi:hypothetical protein